MKSNREIIEEVFKEVIENVHADEAIISRYFATEYVQFVDGHKLSYADFLQHMIAQKSIIESIRVTIERCVTQGNVVATVYEVNAIKKGGEKIVIKVIAYFELKNGKIILCDELTHLVQGSEADQKLGSIT